MTRPCNPHRTAHTANQTHWLIASRAPLPYSALLHLSILGWKRKGWNYKSYGAIQWIWHILHINSHKAFTELLGYLKKWTSSICKLLFLLLQNMRCCLPEAMSPEGAWCMKSIRSPTASSETASLTAGHHYAQEQLESKPRGNTAWSWSYLHRKGDFCSQVQRVLNFTSLSRSSVSFHYLGCSCHSVEGESPTVLQGKYTSLCTTAD